MRVFSISTSCSHVRLKSSDARRNCAIACPRDLPSSGSLRGPKTTNATTRMRIISGIPNIMTSLSLRARAASVSEQGFRRSPSSRYRFLGEFKPLLGLSTEHAETISDALRARQATVFGAVGTPFPTTHSSFLTRVIALARADVESGAGHAD